jgi:uncharacterized protein (DUF2147 family)
MTRLALSLFAAALLAACDSAAPAPPPSATLAPGLEGRWLTQSGNLEVEVAPCGKALCGTVVRVLANKSMADPSRSIGDRPALGLKVLSDFTPGADGLWEGEIYNRENDKTYDCLMTLAAADQMRLRIYVGMPLFGQTQIWQRVAPTMSEK